MIVFVWLCLRLRHSLHKSFTFLFCFLLLLLIQTTYFIYYFTSLIQLLHLFKLLTSSTYCICLFALWPHIESTTAFITLHLSYLLQTLLNALKVLYFDSFILYTTYFTYSNCICLFALWPHTEVTTAFIQLYCYSYSHCSFGPPWAVHIDT